MADNYYTLTDEKGTIRISDDVIAAIALNAVREVDGIASFSNISGADFGELIGLRPAARGIRVGFEEDRVHIDITVMLHYGVNITGTAEKLQKAVAGAVDSMTGLTPEVNVHVSGIAFDK